MSRYVFAVHAIWVSVEGTSGGGIEQGHIEFVEESEVLASGYARKRSDAPHVTAVMVTRLALGELGTRMIVEWWVKGERHTMADRTAMPFFVPEVASLRRGNGNAGPI